MIRNFENGDIVTSGQQFIEGKAATGQGVYHRLRMFTGEYFLNVLDGTPWFQSILGKSPDGVAETAVKQRIISAPDVLNITQFRFERLAKERTIQIEASLFDVNNEQVAFLFDEGIV